MSDELTFNASDNDVAPDSPILLQMKCDSIIINQSIIFENKITLRSNWVSDELIFNASDNDDIPESPISLEKEYD